MKIGILTQSMAANYGCHLQAYALQTTLVRMGHEVEILNRWGSKPIKKNKSLLKRIKVFIKDAVKKCLHRPIYHPIRYEDRPYFWRNFLQFQKNYLNLSKQFYSTDELKSYVDCNPFDGFIVGSDQVWRPDYNKNGMLENMFLDFVSDKNVKRIAYAASFGVDYWSFSENQTRICGKLAKLFDGISVRESSGINLCCENLGVDALHVLDPTLLLGKEDYNSLLKDGDTQNIIGELYCYILDSSAEANKAIRYVEECTGLQSYTCLPLIPEGTYSPSNKETAILPSIEQWLRCFRDAKMVIVDSFHGMVFSIIYNKPFWVIANPKRGMARFTSLLTDLNLNDRLVTYNKLKDMDFDAPIVWDAVNDKLQVERQKSLTFLKYNLGNQ